MKKIDLNEKKVAVLMACHNRRNKTVRSLQALFASVMPELWSIHVVLIDDGSTDGTSDAVRSKFPDVEILHGDGSLFWNRGMHWAFDHALTKGFDAYLLLNDDTDLHPNAFGLLSAAMDWAAPEEVIVVGAVQDPQSGETTYGGARFVSPRFRPFLCTVVHPGAEPLDVDVMNGNVVLIPNSVARILGNLDQVFEHGMGDTDYSMRARKLGIRIMLTAGYVGVCSRNSTKGTHRDSALSLPQRLAFVFSRKGLPWRSWLTMCWRHGGTLWPIHFVWGYVKVIICKA